MAGKIESLEAALAAAATPQQKIDALNALAWELIDLDTRRCQELAQTARRLAESEQYPKGVADSLIAQSQVSFDNFVQVVSNALRALAIYEDLEDRVGRSRALFTLCWAHWSLDNFPEAVDAGQRARKLAQQNGDRALEAAVLNNLALTHKRAGNYELAFAMYAEALAAWRELGDRLQQAKVLTNTALAYAAQGDHARALASARESLALGLATPLVHGYNYLALGQAQAGLGAYDEALRYLPEALDIARKHGLAALEQAALQFTGETHLRRQDYGQAAAALQQAISVGEGIQTNLFVFRCHEILSKVYEARGDLALALAHYRRFHELKETVFNENNTRRRQVLEIYHQTELARQQAEIYHLRNVELEQEIAERKRAEARLAQQAATDELTGAANRRCFVELAAREVKRVRRMGHPLALALMDIDHFKAINDTHGHAVGDEALMSFTRTIRRNIREIDLLARFGGDEFVLLLPEADPEHAAGVVSRLRQALVEHPLNLGGMSVPITVSVGIAGLAPGGEDLDGLLRRADIALYRSKQAGRDRISLAQAED